MSAAIGPMLFIVSLGFFVSVAGWRLAAAFASLLALALSCSNCLAMR